MSAACCCCCLGVAVAGLVIASWPALPLLPLPQVSVVDGESFSETGPSGHSHIKELLKSDEVRCLLVLVGGQAAQQGGMLLIWYLWGSGNFT